MKKGLVVIVVVMFAMSSMAAAWDKKDQAGLRSAYLTALQNQSQATTSIEKIRADVVVASLEAAMAATGTEAPGSLQKASVKVVGFTKGLLK